MRALFIDAEGKTGYRDINDRYAGLLDYVDMVAVPATLTSIPDATGDSGTLIEPETVELVDVVDQRYERRRAMFDGTPIFADPAWHVDEHNASAVVHCTVAEVDFADDRLMRMVRASAALIGAVGAVVSLEFYSGSMLVHPDEQAQLNARGMVRRCARLLVARKP